MVVPLVMPAIISLKAVKSAKSSSFKSSITSPVKRELRVMPCSVSLLMDPMAPISATLGRRIVSSVSVSPVARFTGYFSFSFMVVPLVVFSGF